MVEKHQTFLTCIFEADLLAKEMADFSLIFGNSEKKMSKIQNLGLVRPMWNRVFFFISLAQWLSDASL